MPARLCTSWLPHPVPRMCTVHTLACVPPRVLTSMCFLTHLSRAPRARPPPHLAVLLEKASIASLCCHVPLRVEDDRGHRWS